MPALQLPRLYPIIDVAHFRAAADSTTAILKFAKELASGGATLIQYRNKSGSAQEMLGHARELRRVLNGRVKLIMNNRADLCLAAHFDGVHLGQDDLSPAAARKIFDAAGKGSLWIGYSTHNLEQLREAESAPIDYVAVGPVFSTASKANPDPVIGLEMVRQARRVTTKPLVAIGGITRNNAKFVIEAGADAVAVISDVVESPHKSTEDFLRILG
jgi:thiamine-phosphate pyrophosphorylase